MDYTRCLSWCQVRRPVPRTAGQRFASRDLFSMDLAHQIIKLGEQLALSDTVPLADMTAGVAILGSRHLSAQIGGTRSAASGAIDGDTRNQRYVREYHPCASRNLQCALRHFGRLRPPGI
jgi:hypothetical protein